MAEIRIGTSGYSFKDWVGVVYPPRTPPGQFLLLYAKDFDTVEVNSTFYRTPSPALMARMAENTPDGFEFTVKAPQAMTHERARFAEAAGPFFRALAPLAGAGKLAGVLLQFPQSFHNGPEAADVLTKAADAFGSRGIPAFVEFRHRDWYRNETYGLLERLGLGFVNVDLPRVGALPPPTAIATTDRAYFRLHGRNAEMWYHHPTPSHRYDYTYSDGELDALAGTMTQVAREVEEVHAFSNNCHMGSSYVDALRLKQRLGQPVRSGRETPATLFASGQPPSYVDQLARRVSEARNAERRDIEVWRDGNSGAS